MLSIANKVFRDFKEFYNEINGATLTGAIDVIVVEQPDHTFLCSPFHVRFGKLGVLRSREKIVDIEINGEAIDIHMKLGESGEAFFVEECTEGDLNDVPNLATSPIPMSEMNDMSNFERTNGDSDGIKIPVPRRNSIDLSNNISGERDEKFENQVSDFTQRRHTVENGIGHRDLTISKLELTTQKLRQELSDIQTENFYEMKEKFNQQLLDENRQFCPINDDLCDKKIDLEFETKLNQSVINDKIEESNLVKEDVKSKRKRRKKSMIKKKNAQRKGSSSSSASFSSETPEINSNDASPSTENDNNNNNNNKEEISQSSMTKTQECPLKPEPEHLSDIHFFSDGEIGTTNLQQTRSLSPVQSDTEFEFSQRDKNTADIKGSQVEWKWGQPIVKTDDIEDSKGSIQSSNNRNSMISGMLSFMKQKRKNNVVDGLYLADLDLEDPEVAAVYFPQNKSLDNDSKRDDDHESGNGTSIPQSPSNSLEINKLNMEYDSNIQSADFSLNFISLSLCGGIEKEGGPTTEEFNANIVQYNDICRNPSIFLSPNLVVRINNKFYSWIVACPYIMTLIAFQKELPADVCEKIGEEGKLKVLVDQKEEEGQTDSSRRSWFLWRRGGPPTSGQETRVHKKSETLESQSLHSEDNLNLKSTEELEYSTQKSESYERASFVAEMYRKTLRLNSSQIQSLNLKSGVNEVEFSVTTAYQGTSRCKCFLYKWKHSDKVVISDIDGTITRSDVLGHILPMVGKDWAQIGVAQLFSKIEENGYKILYLSARAIGQSRATRDYLKSIRQGDVKLPEGPLLLNPTSLISAFHREVIERKPEQFKIECLSDVKRLFGEKNPFYAGYGNRINDVWAYRAVGIPIMRIYTINPRGELKHELTQTFQSTYAKQLCIVDQLFPPIPVKLVNDEEDDIEYTSFNFWRETFNDIDYLTDSNVTNISLNTVQSKPLATIPEN